MMRDLVLSPEFTRASKRVMKKNPRVAANVEAALELMKRDVFDPSLNTHKLAGKLAGLWACSAGYNLRILFSFVKVNKKDAILLETVGTHDEVY